jgi:hypothetical protein
MKFHENPYGVSGTPQCRQMDRRDKTNNCFLQLLCNCTQKTRMLNISNFNLTLFLTFVFLAKAAALVFGS